MMTIQFDDLTRTQTISMSVLEDVVTEDGLWIRHLCNHHDATDAREVLTMLRKLPGVRMNEIHHTMNADDVPPEALSHTSPHWISTDGKVCWGLPGGEYTDYLDRILENESYWKDGNYHPPIDREVSEVQAKDLTLAAYLFPFKNARASPHPYVKNVLVRTIQHARHVVAGTDMIAKMILSASHRDMFHQDLRLLAPASGEVRTRASKVFGQCLSMMMTAGSANIYDAQAMAVRSGNVDPTIMEKAWDYISLADLANSIAFAQSLSRKNRVVGKSMAKHLTELRSAKENYENAIRRDAPSASVLQWKMRYESLVNIVEDELDCSSASRRGDLVFAPSKSPNIKIAAVDNLAVVYHRTTKTCYILTNEDIKALKFTAMSHAMWHLYAGTIMIEYGPVQYVEDGHIYELTKALEAELAKAFGQIGMNPNAFRQHMLGMRHIDIPVSQEVVSYRTVTANIDNLWALYVRIVDRMNRNGKSDWTGRYLHTLFGVYTAKITGHLGEAEFRAQLEDFQMMAAELHMDGRLDYEEFYGIMRVLPQSVVQDFGRLSKIVFPYSINAGYAFLKRANDMQNPNAVGKVKWDAKGTPTIEDFTAEEDRHREFKFRCAYRVMLTHANILLHAYASIEDEVAAELEDRPWLDTLEYMQSNGIRLHTEATLKEDVDVDGLLTNEQQQQARSDALHLLNTGKLPANPYAGAYLETSDMLAYKVRDKPDIALIKATNTPPSDLSTALSSRINRELMVATRDTEGKKVNCSNNMVESYLDGKYPSRTESIAHVLSNTPVLSTSVKIETNKSPEKNRIITAGAVPNRRVQSEFEFNNSKTFRHMVGFCVGADPASMRRKQYSILRDDLAPGWVRLQTSLDLTNFSTGMREDIQDWANDELRTAYNGGEDNFRALARCVTNTHMIFSQKNVHLYTRNTTGANYEGLDGKRNTSMHCTLWYLARCEANDRGLTGNMKAFLYIDDGSLSIEVKQEDIQNAKETIMRAMYEVYTAYGFCISLTKTVVSITYMQFLNEVFSWGAHVGYGFRALCHTGAQSFPPLATVREELDVIVSGVRGAAVSGGHPVRLLVGLAFLILLYVMGVIGNNGKSLSTCNAIQLAVLLTSPTMAGGFGVPDIVTFYSNVAGNRDIEALSKVRQMNRTLRVSGRTELAEQVKQFHKKNLMKSSPITRDKVPDRVTVKHPAITQISPRNRTELILEAAEARATGYEAQIMIARYRRSTSGKKTGSFPEAFADSLRSLSIPQPLGMVEKGLDTDPDRALAALVGKIASSKIGGDLMGHKVVRRLSAKYYRDARLRANEVISCVKVVRV